MRRAKIISAFHLRKERVVGVKVLAKMKLRMATGAIVRKIVNTEKDLKKWRRTYLPEDFRRRKWMSYIWHIARSWSRRGSTTSSEGTTCVPGGRNHSMHP